MHCKHQLDINATTDTLLISNKPRIPINQHPIASLLALIQKDSLTCDLVLCPGDLGDKADEQGISSSWGFLEEIKQKFKAQLLIAIPGNHDINSRKNLGKEPFSYIKNFHENFPVTDEKLKSQFWSAGYCFIKTDKIILLLLNTVHNHLDPDKANTSSIEKETLEKIEQELQGMGCNDIHKICVLHHHPIKHSNIRNWKDSDSLDNGDDLISLLNKYSFTIVIHGHKHQPRLIEYSSLPIFATGSFASFANLQATGLETMFHIIELKDENKFGTIISWQFDLINGWNQKENKIFPPRIGFGANLNIGELALRINEIFDKAGRKPIFYDDIIKEISELQFLVPDKLIELNQILKEKYKIKPSPEFPLDPSKLSELLN